MVIGIVLCDVVVGEEVCFIFCFCEDFWFFYIVGDIGKFFIDGFVVELFKELEFWLGFVFEF